MIFGLIFDRNLAFTLKHKERPTSPVLGYRKEWNQLEVSPGSTDSLLEQRLGHMGSGESSSTAENRDVLQTWREPGKGRAGGARPNVSTPYSVLADTDKFVLIGLSFYNRFPFIPLALFLQQKTV